ncbi:MAG: YbgC/FadM family acyl-CoA thioesterase [Candidatus Ornithospirochaeta sp.]|nr:YbgC/FadM family acyl-CoA thioesterase [Candidatus Ornithospirochaeta sp.]
MREFRYRTRVYYSDTDCGGIAYHARYLDWAEHARTEMLRQIMPSLSQREMGMSDLAFVVKSISIEYDSPAFLDDEIEVVTSVEKMASVYGVFSQDVFRGDVLLSHLSVKVAFISLSTKRPVRMDPGIVKALSNQG